MFLNQTKSQQFLVSLSNDIVTSVRRNSWKENFPAWKVKPLDENSRLLFEKFDSPATDAIDVKVFHSLGNRLRLVFQRYLTCEGFCHWWKHLGMSRSESWMKRRNWILSFNGFNVTFLWFATRDKARMFDDAAGSHGKMGKWLSTCVGVWMWNDF